MTQPEKVFAIHEVAAGFQLEHLATRRTYWLSNGRGLDLGTTAEPLTAGMDDFREAWEALVNRHSAMFLEEYFPDLA